MSATRAIPGAVLSAVRAGTVQPPPEATDRSLRIGEVAELTGTTPRTIRYYEEIGLLPGAADRKQGKHRCYTGADVERVREILRLRDLLGLSLDQLSRLLEAESARAELRREYAQAGDPSTRRRILEQALGHIGTQLDLVQGRRRELEQLERELLEKRREVGRRLAECQP
jgi:DNA-binding transcriptional MerR regulator